MTSQSIISTPAADSPFALSADNSYRRWRDRKLADQPASAEDLMVEVADPLSLTAPEKDALLHRLRRANMALYVCPRPTAEPKSVVRTVAAQFGLGRLDFHLCAEDEGITPLQVTDAGPRRRYIPYTSRALNWHTDGYYNAPNKPIRAFMLHCVSDAEDGGENELMDPEIAYLRLRDEDPDFIAALSHPAAMSIPANEEDGTEIRGEIAGPVFSVDRGDGSLHMRYTARTRSIAWRDDPVTEQAVAAVTRLLNGRGRDVLRHRLLPGQGLLTNNVLHRRAAFHDAEDGGKRRLVYRARFFDRAEGTAYREQSSQDVAGPDQQPTVQVT